MQKKHFLLYKKLILFILPILLVPSISFGATGEECMTCGSSPKEFVLINDFTIEMLGQIRTIGTEGKYTGKFVPPSWFESGKFVAPKVNILGKMLRRAKESLSISIGLGNIIQQLGNPISIADEFAILSRNQVFLRDWKKLGLVETAINKKKFELSMGGGREDKITGVPLQRMQGIIEKYKSEGIIDDYKFNGARYYEILVVLGAINNDMKHMIALGGTNAGTKMLGNPDSSSFSSKFEITLSESGINNMQNAYHCALWFKCDNPLNNFKDLGKIGKNGGASAMLEFNKANERFLNETKKMSSDIKKSREDINKKTKEIWGEVKDKTKKLAADYKQAMEDEKLAEAQKDAGIPRTNPFDNWRKKKIDKDLKTNSITDINTSTENTDNKKNSIVAEKMKENMANILSEAQDMDDSLSMSSVDDITPYFSQLVYTISNLTKNIIGSKGQSNTLIENLGQICEKQCTNIGGKKCYY